VSETVQHDLIQRVRERCATDERLTAALMYGSFVHGEGDEFSDVEFWLFFADEAFDLINPDVWIGEVAPVHLVLVNEFGAHVAIFTSLVRGEFHFQRASAMPVVRTWSGLSVPPDLMLVVDRTGELRGHLEALRDRSPFPADAESVQSLCARFLNWFLFGLNVYQRGELARAQALLGQIDVYLLWMARLREGQVRHWLTPSRSVERELSAAVMADYRRCTSGVNRQALGRTYAHAWQWARSLIADLQDRYTFRLPDELLNALEERVASEAGLLGPISQI
jgi:lincosamide nucleotidyltransferase